MTRGPLLVTGGSSSLAVSSSELPNLVESIRCGARDVSRGLSFNAVSEDSVNDL